MKLTDQFVKGASTDEKQIEIPDDACIGLKLRVTKAGTKTWAVVVWNGHMKKAMRRTLGTYPKLKLADARKAADAVRDLLANNRPADGLTFGLLCDEFIEKYAKLNKTSWDQDEQTLKIARIAWGNAPAAEVTRKQVVELLDQIAATAPVKANRTKSLLSKMFKWGKDRDLLSVNPIEGWTERPGGKETPKDRVLDDDEIRLVFRKLPTSTVGNAIRTVLLTMQRPGEVCAARIEDIDLDEKLWLIPAEVAKNGRAHEVPLTDMAVRLLRIQIHGRAEGWVFEGRADAWGVVDSHLTRAAMSRACKKVSGVASFSPHDLRRTGATGARKLGAAVSDISSLLNHVEQTITAKVYALSDRRPEKQRTIDVYTKWLEALDLGI